MRLSASVDYAGDLRAGAARAADLEAAGVDLIWVPEVYGFDAVSVLGYLAAITNRAELGTGIMNVYSRTPAAIAQTAAGLDAVSEGRFVLGLGASGPQVVEGFHGVAYDRPVTRVREVVDICRMAWRREPLEYHGRVFELPLPPERGTGLGRPLKLINQPRRDRIPVYVAALGARAVEMCAEVADGWLPFLFVPEWAGGVWGEALARGRARRPEGLGPLEVVAGGITCIGPHDEAARARELARPTMALYIGGMGARGRNFYNDLCRAYGFEAEAAEVQDLYLSGRRDEAAARVPGALVEGATLCGDEAYVAERLAAHRQAGVTMLNVRPVGPDPGGTLARLRELLG